MNGDLSSAWFPREAECLSRLKSARTGSLPGVSVFSSLSLPLTHVQPVAGAVRSQKKLFSDFLKNLIYKGTLAVDPVSNSNISYCNF
jgi:hypothetical protein